MNEYDTVLAATETALNSQGSGYRENTEYLKSFESQINMVKNAYVEAIISARDSGLGDAMVTGLQAGLLALNALTALIDKIGILPTVLGGGSVAMLLLSERARTMALSVDGGTRSLIAQGVALLKNTSDKNSNTLATTALTSANTTSSASIKGLGISMIGASTATSTATVATTGMAVALRGLIATASTFVLPIAGLMALGAVFAFVTEKVVGNIKEQKELNKQVEEYMRKGTDAVSVNKEEVDRLTASYSVLRAKQEEGSLTTDEEADYLRIQNELAEIFPSIVDHIDNKGNSHLKTSEEIKKEKDAMLELLKVEEALRVANANDVYKEKIKNIKDYTDAAKNASRRENFADDKTRLKSQAERLKNEMLASNDLDGIVTEMSNILGIQLRNIPEKVSPAVQEAMSDLGKLIKLDSKDLDPSSLEAAVGVFLRASEDMDKAFKADNKAEFKNVVENLSKELSSLGIEVDVSSMSIEELAKIAEKLKRKSEETGVSVDDLGEEISGLGGSAEDAEEQFKELISSIGEINKVLEDYAENNEISTSSMLSLIEKYPELIAYINDEAAFIEHLTEIRDQDISNAEQQIIAKLSMSEDFYNANLTALQQYFTQHFKWYEGDLSQFKSLADAKAAVEQQLIEQLSKKWAVYFNTTSQLFETQLEAAPNSFYIPGADPGMEKRNAAAVGNMLSANAALKDFRSSWDQFTLDRVDLQLDKVGTSLEKGTENQKKNSKATDKSKKSQDKLNDTTKKAIYLADNYADALRKIDLQMSKLNETKERYNEWDKEHIAALKEEMALLEGKKALIQSEAADINNQINTGNHVQTGVVTYDTGTTSGAYTGKYAAEINKAAKTYNIDPFLIAAVIKAESGFNPNARSGAGAQGLMQLMPATARGLGVKNSYNPEQNIMGGTKYLAQQMKAFGNDIRMALAAYNAGPGNVKKYGGIPPFKETKNYVNKVTADYAKSGQAGVTQAVQTAVSQSMHDYYLKGNFRSNQGVGHWRGDRQHTGLDLIAKSGTDIKSVKSGTVRSKGYHKSAGNYIDITQSDGTIARYLHMKNPSALVVGASVEAGASVGKVGSTGSSTTPHLHLEIRDPKQKSVHKGDFAASYGRALDTKSYLKNNAAGYVQTASSGGGSSGGTQGQAEANYASEKDKLRADLDKASQDLLALNSQIREQRRAIWEAGAAKAKKNKEETDKVLQNSDNRLKKHDPASKEYRNELEAQKTLLKNKEKYNQQEIDHWKKVQRSKGLTNKDQEYVKAKLHELGLEKNVIKFEIDDKAVQQLESYAKRFDDRRKQIDREYEYEQTKLEGLNHGSDQYFKTLEKIASLTDRNLGIDEHESQKLRAAIKSGELYGENLKAAKERLEELRNSIAKGKLEQQINIMFIVEQKGIAFDNKRDKREQEKAYELTKLKEVDIASDRYGKTLDKLTRLMKDQQKTNKEELAYLEATLASKKLNAAGTKELTDRIWELKSGMVDLNLEIQNLDLERLDVLMRVHERTIADLSYEYQRSQAIMKFYEEGTAEYNAELVKQIDLIGKEANAVRDKRNALQNEILTMNLSVEAIEEKKKELQSLSLEYYGLMGTLRDTEKALEASRKKMAEEAADKLIEAFKSYISEKRDMHMKSLDEEVERENKRHQKVMDNYKDELEAFRKIIQEKINSIDDQEEERVYSKEINKLEEERIKVLDKINLLSLDDSLEAKAERKKLSEDLSRIDEEIFEKRNAKEISDRKENLNKILEDREEQTKKEEELAEEQHKDTIDRIDKERSYWEKFYTDQLNDERKFAKMKEDIIAGNFANMSKEFQEYIKEMEDTMPSLEDTLDGTMQAVGTSIRKNIIDSLKEALDLLNKVGVESGKGSVSAPSDSATAGGGGGGSKDAKLGAGDLNVLTGKFYTERLALQESDEKRKARIKEKGYELASKGRADGSEIRSDQGLNQILADMGQVKREEFAKHLLGSGSQHVSTPELQDFIKKFGNQLMGSSMKLNTGGYIKKGSEGLAMLHEEEVVLNKNETKKLFNLLPTLENFQQMMNPIQLPKLSLPDIKGVSEGDTIYQFDVHIDNLNGTKKDADNFMAEIDNRLKRKGLR